MGAIVVVLLLALVFAAAIILYVAYPYRGEATPLTPRLGEAMRRGVEALPTLESERVAPQTVSIAPAADADRVDAHR
jgi:hypothetical protein